MNAVLMMRGGSQPIESRALRSSPDAARTPYPIYTSASASMRRRLSRWDASSVVVWLTVSTAAIETP